MMKFLCFLCFALTWSSFQTASLPSYLHPCKKGDFDCMTKEASNVLKSILKGDKKLGIPSLTPLVIPKVELIGANLRLEVTNCRVDSLEQIHFKAVNLDVDKKTGLVDLDLPKLQFSGQYKLQGKLAVLDLNGEGDMVIDISDPTGLWKFKFDIVDGHGKITDSEYAFTEKNAKLTFENIITGNPQLSQATNDVINENSDVVISEFKPSLEATLKSVFIKILSSYFEKYLLSELIV